MHYGQSGTNIFLTAICKLNLLDIILSRIPALEFFIRIAHSKCSGIGKCTANALLRTVEQQYLQVILRRNTLCFKLFVSFIAGT